MVSTDDRRARFEARIAKERVARGHGDDLRAAAGVVVAATQGVMGVVANMQEAFSPPVISSISSIVNAVVRGTTGLVGTGVDAALAALTPWLGASVPGDEREALLAALNGVIGDRLEAQKSPLAIPMTLRPALDERRRGALLLLVHGSSASDRQWTRRTGAAGAIHDHGRALLDDIERDVTLAYLHYNSGRHIKHNGDDLARLLEAEHDGFDEVILIAHSMGGLVARSAVCAAERAGHAWRKKVSVLATIGTPHHGSPLERVGHIAELILGVTPWTAPLGALGAVRSAGVTDLRYGNVVDVDADRFAFAPDARTHAPLPEGVRCYAIAGTNSAELGDDIGKLANDNLVPVPSALGIHDDRARTLLFTAQEIAVGTDHVALLASDDVYRALLSWCSATSRARPGVEQRDTRAHTEVLSTTRAADVLLAAEVHVQSAVNEVQIAGTTVKRSCHACAFFHSRDEYYETLLPFIRDGIAAGEKAFHVLDRPDHEEHRQRMARADINIDASTDSGQLEVRAWEEAYLKPGHFSQDAMLELIQGVLKDSRAAGYPMTRLVANMEWACKSDVPGVKDIVKYETRLNYVLPKYDDVVVCTYDLNKHSASVVMDIMRTHPAVIIGGIMQENPFFVAPDQLLSELQERRS